MRTYDPIGTCENIFYLAGEKGLSDSKLARSMGMTPQAVCKWRRSVGAPSLDTLVSLADLFKVPLDELVEWKEMDMSFHYPDER